MQEEAGERYPEEAQEEAEPEGRLNGNGAASRAAGPRSSRIVPIMRRSVFTTRPLPSVDPEALPIS